VPRQSFLNGSIKMFPFSISSNMRLSESIILYIFLFATAIKNKNLITLPTINQQKKMIQ
jgi:hypothetical protein